MCRGFVVVFFKYEWTRRPEGAHTCPNTAVISVPCPLTSHPRAIRGLRPGSLSNFGAMSPPKHTRPVPAHRSAACRSHSPANEFPSPANKLPPGRRRDSRNCDVAQSHRGCTRDMSQLRPRSDALGHVRGHSGNAAADLEVRSKK